jgi:hypothetical protein
LNEISEAPRQSPAGRFYFEVKAMIFVSKVELKKQVKKQKPHDSVGFACL